MPAVKNLTDKFLFNTQPEMLDEARRVAKVKGMSLSAFIREAIARSLRYHNKVEKPVYDGFHKNASEAELPVAFFSNAFGVTSIDGDFEDNGWSV